MEPHGPGNLPLVDYLINLAIAVAGASVRFLREWRDNFNAWKPGRVVIEGLLAAITAGFVGALTYWVLASWVVGPLYIAFACGIMGHMGPEGIALLKDIVTNGLRSRSQTPPQ